MKNFSLFAFLTVATLVFSSCSSNETTLPEEQSLDLLKSFTIKRDTNGAYYTDYSFNGNVATENVFDANTNTSSIYLFPSDNFLTSNVTENLTISGGQFKIGFIDTNSKNQPQITIKDDNLLFYKNADENEEMLSEYSISGNEDGTYTLDFTVNNKVSVDFVYNEDLNIYEIHLEEGKSDALVFSRVFEKNENETLKIDFVNHIIDTTIAAKALTEDGGYTYTRDRRPEVIIN